MEVIKYAFNKRRNDTGNLVFLEACRDIPFEIKRIYYIYEVEKGARRGFHAHKLLQQVLICIHGSCKIILDNGKEQATVILDNPAEGLYVGNATWREMYDFSSGAILMVLASDYFDEQDYIRDYEEFLRYHSTT